MGSEQSQIRVLVLAAQGFAGRTAGRPKLRVARLFNRAALLTRLAPGITHVDVAMASKRLIKELQQYQKDPSPALDLLEPVSEDDLFHLVAILIGPDGTAYEGIVLVGSN